MNRRVPCAGLAIVVLAGLSAPWLAGEARAQADPVGAMPGVRANASVEPGIAKLGEPLMYRGRVVSSWRGMSFKFVPPEVQDDFVWGPIRARIAAGQVPPRLGAGPAPAPGPDTFLVEIPLQVFRTGAVTVPGLRFESHANNGATALHRLPAVQLVLTSVLSAADSNADLRPVRGPIGAPWWERIPWPLVIAAVLLIAAIVWLVRRARSGMKRPAPFVAPPPPHPAAVALAELATLRRLGLPAQGRFADHAFQLSRLLRRFLEATAFTPRPGDTTGELIAHLEASDLAREDLEQLAGLLRIWDRVKFGRAPSSPDDASRAEQAVENLARRALPSAAPRAEAA